MECLAVAEDIIPKPTPTSSDKELRSSPVPLCQPKIPSTTVKPITTAIPKSDDNIISTPPLSKSSSSATANMSSEVILSDIPSGYDIYPTLDMANVEVIDPTKVNYPAVPKSRNPDDIQTTQLLRNNFCYKNAMDDLMDEYMIASDDDQMEENIIETQLKKEDQQKYKQDVGTSQIVNTKQQSKEAVPLKQLPALSVHKIQRYDTLQSLCIQYGVLVDDVKRINNIVSNSLDFFDSDEILIPHPKYMPKETGYVYDEAKQLEKKKKLALKFFTRLKVADENIAKYYLMLHNWNIRRAVREYDYDIKWEKRTKKRRRKRQRVHYNTFDGLFDRLLSCFPRVKARKLDSDTDMRELDEIGDSESESELILSETETDSINITE